MVLWSAQGMSVAQIAGPKFTRDDRVRDVLRNFNADGLGWLYPGYAGGHPPKFTLGQRREIKKLAESAPAEHGLRPTVILTTGAAAPDGDPAVARRP
jgi:hypothetical protein